MMRRITPHIGPEAFGQETTVDTEILAAIRRGLLLGPGAARYPQGPEELDREPDADVLTPDDLGPARPDQVDW